MVAWSNGYVADIPYTHGFFRRTTPAHIRLTAALRGCAEPETDAIAYAELGCGQGFGTALVAASNPEAQVYGFDFNPEQIAHARGLARRADLRNLVFEEMSFEEMAALPRSDLPEFDVVALHGVYSWISPAARAAIRAFLRTKLKPGGLVYISYNTMPGCAAVQPLQRLMREEAARASGPSDARAAAALAAVQDLAARGLKFFKDHPAIARRLETHRGQSTTYLAHEYLNGHWHPLYFADLAAELEDAKLAFVGSARLTDNEPRLAFPEDMAALVEGIDDPIRRETLADYWANRPFRVDIFQKGRVRLQAGAARARLRDERVGLRVAPDKVNLSFALGSGQLDGRREAFAPILDRLADGPASLGELEAALGGQAGLAMVSRMVMLLDAGDQLCAAPLRTPESAPALRLNAAVAEAWRGPYRFVAAPALGSALEASPDDLLLLRLVTQGASADVESLVAAVQGLSGEVPEGDDAKRAEAIQRSATRFVADVLPLWRRAGVLADAARGEAPAPRLAAVS